MLNIFSACNYTKSSSFSIERWIIPPNQKYSYFGRIYETNDILWLIDKSFFFLLFYVATYY